MDECNICCEEISINSNKLILKCNHIYHKKCINMWFKKNNYKLCKKKTCKCTERYSSCPTCRIDINIFLIKPKYIQFYELYIVKKLIKCNFL